MNFNKKSVRVIFLNLSKKSKVKFYGYTAPMSNFDWLLKGAYNNVVIKKYRKISGKN